MSEQHKKELEKQLWNIANALRGNMGADEFRDYILGFIFYKYLSEKMHLYADELLQEDGIKYDSLDANTDEGQQYLEAIKKESINQLGYFLLPDELFHAVSEKGVQGEFVIESLTNVMQHIEQVPWVQTVKMILMAYLMIWILVQINWVKRKKLKTN